MKKIILCFVISLLSLNSAFAQMSDEQIMNYVQQEYTKGTSQQDIATNLLKRGVTREQLERIKKEQENKQSSASTSSGTSGSNQQRTRSSNNGSTTTTNNNSYRNNSANNKKENSSTAYTSSRGSKTNASDKNKDMEGMLEDEDFDPLDDFFQSVNRKDSIEVFGRNIFNTKNLTFNPDVNMPTPIDYRLGAGDEVIIDIWGASQSLIRQTISPDGSITVDRLGPIYLNGMTIKEANDYVQRKFTQIYAGIDTGGASHIKLTLGQIRTIQVNVMGEVLVPGTYSLSSLSSVFHALYSAGGINDIGSLRSVKLYRNGKLLRTLDVYEYIMQGKANDNIRLTDGDVISIPSYVSLIKIVGNVKRPMHYEMLPKETAANLINYAGGFSGDAYSKKIKVVRTTGGESKIFTVDEDDYKSFLLNDNDEVTVEAGLGLFENRVEIKGAVYRNGYFEIGNNINTVKQLILAADGVRGDAFLNRCVLTREKEDYTTEIISINVRELLYGNEEDVVLRKNDILYIPSINDLREYGDLVIYGEVAREGEYKYSDNMTLEDLIIQAGGLLESASVVRADVARRIINPHSVAVNRALSDTYSFQIKDGFIIDGEKGFVLKPYDQVYVRRSPGYREQQNVTLEGELLFPGIYALNKKTERISDIIKRAGDLTPDAYPQGARLVRERSKEEIFRAQTALKLAADGGKDSISVKKLNIEEAYSVGIELDKVITNPGSDYDLVLRKGDKLIIPEYDNTVKINGAVMYPNTVAYKKGERISYYINQAGGYADTAKKNKSFVIYMNGTVSKIKGSDREAVKPGSEIIIPSKEDAKRLSLPEILSLGTSVTSMASLIGVLINTMK